MQHVRRTLFPRPLAGISKVHQAERRSVKVFRVMAMTAQACIVEVYGSCTASTSEVATVTGGAVDCLLRSPGDPDRQAWLHRPRPQGKGCHFKTFPLKGK